MLMQLLIAAAALLIIFATAVIIFIRRTVGWGATPEERSLRMPVDEYFTGDSQAFVAMTRAITIEAPTETVWPWLAQMGRGAGFYSVDRMYRLSIRSWTNQFLYIRFEQDFSFKQVLCQNIEFFAIFFQQLLSSQILRLY